jgi:hypothetical protein
MAATQSRRRDSEHQHRGAAEGARLLHACHCTGGLGVHEGNYFGGCELFSCGTSSGPCPHVRRLSASAQGRSICMTFHGVDMFTMLGIVLLTFAGGLEL